MLIVRSWLTFDKLGYDIYNKYVAQKNLFTHINTYKSYGNAEPSIDAERVHYYLA